MKKMFLAVSFVAATLSMYAQKADNMVIPRPQEVEYVWGYVTVPHTVALKDDFGLGEETTGYITSGLKDRYDISLDDSVHFVLNLSREPSLPEEGYRLNFTSRSIGLSAATESGIFYGMQTLFQMLDACGQYGYQSYTFNCQTIVDAPRFPWRAYMLDEARHFMGKEVVKNILDEMARLKMNVFHWHLVNDAGWRIESRKYPELTRVGSVRMDTEICGWKSGMTMGEPHGGFYTQEEIREIVEYARLRHIRIVPEISMPGHASAAIAAYPWLGITKEKIEVPVKFGKHYCSYDVIDPKVVRFLQDIILEVSELFDADLIHIGGDEVRFDQWEADRDLCAYKKKMGFNSFMDIQIDFTNRMSDFAAKNGITIMGWNELLGKNFHAGDNISFAETSTAVNEDVIIHFWVGDPNEVNRAAKQGNRIVNSNNEYTYIDYNYDALPLEKAYGFDPMPADLAPEYQSKILGLGCQMWTEWAATPQDVYIGTFPRIAAFAEDGWTEPAGKDYDSFIMRLKLLVPQWKAKGISVYPSPEL